MIPVMERDLSKVGNKEKKKTTKEKKKRQLQAKTPCTDLFLCSAKGAGERAGSKSQGKAAPHTPVFLGQRDMVQSKRGCLAQFLKKHSFLITHSHIINCFLGLHSTETLQQRPLERLQRSDGGKNTAPNTQGLLQVGRCSRHQTSDNLLSGKQLLFCHARVFMASVMLPWHSLLPRAEHRFCFPGKATRSLDGARLLLGHRPN